MCSLKVAQMQERSFRAAKELVQPSAAQDSFLPSLKKILISHRLSSLCLLWILDSFVKFQGKLN